MRSQKGIGAIAVVVILAIAAIAGGLFYLSAKKSSYPPATSPESQQQATVTSTIPVNDSSDAALDKGNADVETKLKAADSDAVNIDAGLNDKQGDLSE